MAACIRRTGNWNYPPGVPGSPDRVQRTQPTIPYAKFLRLLSSESHASGPAEGHARDAPCPATGSWPDHLHSRSWWSASSLRTSRRLTDEAKPSDRDGLRNPIRLAAAKPVVDDRRHGQLVSPAYKRMIQSPAAVYADLIVPAKTGEFWRAPKNSPMGFPRCTVHAADVETQKCQLRAITG